MDYKDVEKLCIDKAKELLEKYFGNLIKEASVECPETIGEYSIDLPLKIEAEYRAYLKDLWKEISHDDKRTIDDLLDKKQFRDMMTEDERERVAEAYRDAERRTIWERISKTNHKDVTYYKGLLKEYTQELLFCMRHDFLEEIT